MIHVGEYFERSVGVSSSSQGELDSPNVRVGIYLQVVIPVDGKLEQTVSPQVLEYVSDWIVTTSQK